MKAFWIYTAARFGVFLATYAALWLICFSWVEWGTLTNLSVLFAAAVISAIISLFVLAGLREELARTMQERATRINARIEESRRAEDDD